MQLRNERVMRRRSKRRGLFLWRSALCLCLLSLLFAAARGTTAVIEGMSSPRTDSSAREDLSSAGPPASAALPAAAPASSAPASGLPAQRQKPEARFDDALFIGDSRTEALRNYDGLDGATYCALKGLMVNTVYTRREISVHGKKMTVMQAAAAQKYGKIYVMLGLNELGWSRTETFVSDYKKIVGDLRKEQPGARIYLQSVLPVSAKKSSGSSVYNNDKIASYNAAIQKIAAEEGAVFLNVAQAVSSGGALPPEASADGVHLNSAYCAKWCAYLKTHTEP